MRILFVCLLQLIMGSYMRSEKESLGYGICKYIGWKWFSHTSDS